MIKRLFDLGVAAAGLVVLSPMFLIIGGLIKMADRGPVFYRGWRVGRFGRPFRIFKFRSMVVDAERLGGSSTADDDPRLTSVGRILRKYKLDELPQLLNVFLGDMSMVGPRPEVQRFTDMYRGEEKAILNLRPGITDWASIWNSDEGAILAGSEDADRAYLELIRPRKIKLQLQYLREQSLLTDLKIIFQTLTTLLGRRSPWVQPWQTE